MSKKFQSFEELSIKSDRKTKYYNHIGIPTEGTWFANPVMQTEDRICEKHDLYTDKLMRFPTNHINWVGCPKCKEEQQQLKIAQDLRREMAARGMKWDNAQKKFISNEIEQAEDQPVIKYSKYRMAK